MKNVEDLYPLSPLQRGFLVHLLADPSSGVGFEQAHGTLLGPLDAEAFTGSWQAIVDRHPILRTAFVSKGLKEPLQVVRRQVKLPLERQDWLELSSCEQRARLEAYMATDRQRGFEPSRAPLMRLALFRTAADRHVFVWSHHHLLLDGWCKWLVLKEVFTHYDARDRNVEPDLPPSAPYRDYIAWSQKQDLGAAASFWREMFRDSSGCATALAQERQPEARAGRDASYCHRTLRLDGASAELLRLFARSCGVTLSTLVQAVWPWLLVRYTGRRDVVFGTTVSGRPADLPNVDSMMGMFINNLPVRLQVPHRVTVGSWLRHVQERLTELRQYEYSSLHQILEWSGLSGVRNLFDSLVLFQNYPMGDLRRELPQLRLELASFHARLETSFPLTLYVLPQREILFRIYYDRRSFAATAVSRMLGHLETLLRSLIADADRPLDELPMLCAAERHAVLYEHDDPPPDAGDRWPALKLAGVSSEEPPRIRLLDGRLRPVPVGVVGDIFAAGPCRPDLTAQRPGSVAEHFVPDPLGDVSGARLYRTGDRGRWLPQGDLEVHDAVPPTVEEEADHCGEDVVAPRTPVELQVLRLWQDLFPTRRIGVTDNFFELGGTSVLALHLIEKLRARFGHDLPLAPLFNGGTVEALARVLEARLPSASGSRGRDQAHG